LALRALVARYGELQAAGRGTAQRRGQQFNALVADLLRLWGIDAEAGVIGIEGRDEVDVTFTLGDTPYLLEAKWHARPVPADAASKLADHIRQRLRGTRGVVLSMSGYTRNAAPAAERGQQPEVLLLDRSHFEAMLSGLMAPDQLLQAVVRQASRRGGVYVALADVLLPERPPEPPTVRPVTGDNTPWEVVRDTAGGVAADAVLLGDPGWATPSGLGASRDGRLLVTTPDGIVEVDPARGTTGWALPLRGCRATPMTDPDGAIVTVCHSAVVRCRGRTVEIIGGGFTGNSNLLTGPDDTLWVFDNTGSTYAGLLSLTRLGPRLGAQQSHIVEDDPGAWNAGWLDKHRFLLAGGSYHAVVDLDSSGRVDRGTWIDSPQSGPRAVVVRDPTTVVTAAYDQSVRGSVYQTNVTTGSSGRLALLAVNAVHGLAAVGGEAYLLADVSGNDPQSRPVLMRLSGVLLSPTARR
jgi:hypothetical protein